MFVNPISYPGNKNRILRQLIPEFPPDAEYFVDVFCGSGVVGANSSSQFVICNDINRHCIDVLKYFYEKDFSAVISDLEAVIDDFGLSCSFRDGKTYFEKKHEGLSVVNRDAFNRLKDSYNNLPTIPKLIVLLIYGFNHYMRFNGNDRFNVPVGKVDLSTSIYKNLDNFVNSIKVKTMAFSNKDFRDESLYEYKNAIYYFDPPYLITSAPYNNSWSVADEKGLLALLDKLTDQNKKFCLSNVFLSNGKRNNLLIDWSKKYKVVYFKRQYRNSNYQKINVTDSIEVLIKNY